MTDYKQHPIMMTDLSTQAQAVWNAYYDNSGFEVYSLSEVNALAAALVAAADQVNHHWDGMECVDYLCAIAAELRGQDQQNSALSPPSEGD